MADPKDNKDSTTNKYEDEFDAMLNEAKLLRDGKDKFFDKDDPIEQLLVDDGLDIEGEENKDDEFANNEPSNSIIEEAMPESQYTEKGVKSNDPGSMQNKDKPAEITDNMDEIDGFVKNMAESEVVDDSAMDFLMADFDISAGDELAEDDSVNELYSQAEELDNRMASEKAEEMKVAMAVPAQALSQSAAKMDKNNPEIEKIISRIERLSAENDGFEQQIAELSASVAQSNASGGELENLQKEQRRLRKTIDENETKLPLVAYIALGLAILSLLTHALMSIVGSGSSTDVEALTELVATLEEEVEILSAQSNTVDNNKIELRLNTLSEKNDRLNNQLAEINGTLLNSSSGQTVDALLEKNAQAQKTVEQLLSRVEKLENRKSIVKATSPVKKKVKPLALAESKHWFVNLVSFRQKWYADKKAAEFEKKGVPTEVVGVKVKAEDWFRLRVKGFKSKYDAASYAVKVKKTLNLSSVWVTAD